MILRFSPTAILAEINSSSLRSFTSAFLAGCLTAGCTTSKTPEPVHVSKLSDAALQQAKRECVYEAKKATASAKPGYAYYPWLRVYVMCLDLKGVKYIEQN